MDTIDTISVGAVSIDTPCQSQRPLRLAVKRIVKRVSLWSVKRRSRRDLRDLTEEQLRDIGVSPSEVRRELAKSFFWD